MKKKLFITASIIFLILAGGLLVTSYVLARRIASVAELRRDDPKLIVRGELERSKRGKHVFAYEICSYFPVKIQSDTPEDKAYGQALCDVTFGEEKLALNYHPRYLADVLSIFDHVLLRDYKSLPVKEKIQMLFESQGPGPITFLTNRREFEQSILYLFNGMQRKFHSWEKYHRGKYLIYIWDITRGSFKELKVQLFTDEYSITCMGTSCVDYLFTSGVL
jgi:hypothetical protein